MRRKYPSVYILFLEKTGRLQELVDYMQTCKNYEEDAVEYSRYVHGYWLPELQEHVYNNMKVRGRL